MKKIILLLGTFALLFCFTSKTVNAQGTLTDEEYSYVTMDLRGILDLTMTSDPNIDFLFDNIMKYKLGIVKHASARLEVEATVAWDLFIMAESDAWTQVQSYSTNGIAIIPAEILEVQSDVDNTTGGAVEVFSALTPLLGPTLAGCPAGGPAVATTQYLAGALGLTTDGGTDGLAFAPGLAMDNPTTHQFKLDYRIVPGLPASFPNNTTTTGWAPTSSAQAGYYYIEVMYCLTEDL
jgi:hypothetical protein